MGCCRGRKLAAIDDQRKRPRLLANSERGTLRGMSAEGSQPRPSLGERFAATALEVTTTIAAIATGFAVLQLLILLGVFPGPGDSGPASLLGGPLLMGCAAMAYSLSQRHFRSELCEPLVSADGGARPGRSQIAWQIPALLMALFGGSAAISAILDALGLPIEEQALVRAITDGGWRLDPNLLALAFSALVLAPVAEEWLFRHLLFRRVYLAAGPGWAYGASACLFALSHFNASGLPIYMWQAVVFATAYRVTGRLWAAIIVHFGNNALTLVLLLSDLA